VTSPGHDEVIGLRCRRRENGDQVFAAVQAASLPDEVRVTARVTVWRTSFLGV
jgi:hypothetical protein